MTTGITLGLVVAAASAAFALTPMWELEVKTSHPQFVTIKTPKGDVAHWYVAYTVKNQHDEAKAMRPVATLAGNIGSARRDIYEPQVLEAVQERTGFKHANVVDAAGILKPGEERECVAVFNTPNHDSSKMTLSIYGLAGKRVEKQNGQTGIASRLYKVEYTTTGDRYNFTPERLKLVSKGFVDSFRSTFEGEGKILGEAPEGNAVKLPDSAGPAANVLLTVDAPPVGAVSADPLDLLPGGVKGLGYVNFRQLVDVGLIDQIFNLAGEQGINPNDQLKKIGLDLKKDLDAAAFVVGDFTAPEDNGAVVVTGRFDADLIRNTIKQEAGDDFEAVEYKGYSLVMAGRDDLGRICVLDGKALVIGTEDFVKKIIDIHKGDAKAGAKASPLMARARDLGDRTFWIVADVEIPPLPEEQAGMLAMALPGLDTTKINGITISGKIEKAFDLWITLGCKDEDSAAGAITGLKQGVNALTGMANMFSQNDPEAGKTLGELIRAIKISGRDTSATINLTITAELAEKLKVAGQKMAGPMMMMMMQGGGGGMPDDGPGEIDWGEEE
ncbi:MAG: hypothetical protein HQ592_10165 [Planctomycetes bacterium]|nr:hypothetical protein [Planctomycetota bacterium]